MAGLHFLGDEDEEEAIFDDQVFGGRKENFRHTNFGPKNQRANCAGHQGIFFQIWHNQGFFVQIVGKFRIFMEILDTKCLSIQNVILTISGGDGL